MTGAPRIDNLIHFYKNVSIVGQGNRVK